MKLRRLLVAAGIVLAIGALWAAVAYERRVEKALVTAPLDGSDVTLQFLKDPESVPSLTVQDLDGRSVSSDSWKGKVILVNFWATWCPPCRAEIPDLIALQEEYRDRLQIIGVSEDEASVATVKQFVQETKINYPVVMSTPELKRVFSRVYALPTTFLVDRDGKIVRKHVGMLNPAITDLETSVLAGLTVNAKVEHVEMSEETGLISAANATEIPGLDLTTLTPTQRTAALKRLNEEHCTCGCDLTLAECRLNDPSCEVSLPAAQKVVAEIAGQP